MEDPENVSHQRQLTPWINQECGGHLSWRANVMWSGWSQLARQGVGASMWLCEDAKSLFGMRARATQLETQYCKA